MISLAGVRTRWAAIGAACAVTLGAGGFGVVNAVVSSGEKSVYVPVSPIRVLDTRGGTTLSGGTHRLVVEGLITVTDGSSQQIVPTEATAIAINVTATSTRKNGDYGYVTVYPCTSDADTPPNASSLNFETDVDIANALNVTTSANGSICLYVFGTADLIVDIAGYFTDHNHDDRYFTKAEVVDALSEKSDSVDLVQLPVPNGAISIDDSGDSGAFSSIAIGSNGNPVVSYLDNEFGDLKIAVCTSSNCADVVISTLDSSGHVGTSTSITIGHEGNPVVSYYDLTNRDLKAVACANPLCTVNHPPVTLDAVGEVGSFSSIAIGVNGNPIISYHDASNYYLKVVACTTSTCSAYNPPLALDTDIAGGRWSSIAIGVNGNPIISYYDDTHEDLRVVACANPTCSAANPAETLDSDGTVGPFTSIAIGADGNPIVSYFDGDNLDLMVVTCSDISCSEANAPVTIDTAGDVGWDTSIAIGSNGHPIISYFDRANSDLKVAVCEDSTCASAYSATLTTQASSGFHTSLAIGLNGVPVISYYDQPQGLKVFIPWWMIGGR
jgi:hypothetical protein